MENFVWTQFTRKIPISTSVETLYNAWTIPSEIERWFLKDATFLHKNSTKRTISSAILKDDVYEWKWFQWDGVEMVLLFELMERTPFNLLLLVTA